MREKLILIALTVFIGIMSFFATNFFGNFVTKADYNETQSEIQGHLYHIQQNQITIRQELNEIRGMIYDDYKTKYQARRRR